MSSPLLVLLVVAAVAVIFILLRPKRVSSSPLPPVSSPEPAPAKVRPKRVSSSPLPPASSPEPAPAPPAKKSAPAKVRPATPQPLATAEVVFNLGPTFPLSFSLDSSGRYLFVACNNRQQLLFSIANLTSGQPTKVLQRYKLTEDTVCDCAFVSRASGDVEVALGLDRDREVRSFVLIPTSTKFTPGPIAIRQATKYSILQVRVAPDASFVAVLGDDTYIRLFQADGTHLFAKDTSQQRNYELAVSSNSELVGVSSYTSEAVIYGVDRDRKGVPARVTKAFTLSDHRNSVHTIDFDSKTMIAVTGGKDRKFNVFQTPLSWREQVDPKLIWSGSTEPDDIVLVRIAPGGETIAILLAGGTLAFCTKKGGIVKTIEFAHNVLENPADAKMAWEASGRWVFLGSAASPFIYAYENPRNTTK
jgi:WD40 repeat protein